MKLQPLFAGLLAACLCGCAAPSRVEQTWKSPKYTGGPVQKVAVVGVDERFLVRQVIESHFGVNLTKEGQAAMVTYDLMGLAEMKADRAAAAAKIRENGADAVMVVRLVDSATRANEVRATPALFVPTVEGFGYDGWGEYFTVAFTDMGTIWGSATKDIYLETVLFDLKTNQRIWSGLTLTVFKDNMDRVEELGPLTSKIFAAMRKDGVIH